MAISSMFILSSCSSSNDVSPSQNDVLKSVSPNGKEKAGFMQKSMESWIKDEWIPTVTKDKEIQKKYMKKVSKPSTTTSENDTEIKKVKVKEKVSKKTVSTSKYEEDTSRNFTLQEYVDKASVYNKAHPSDYKNSNVKRLDSMPVIGK